MSFNKMKKRNKLLEKMVAKNIQLLNNIKHEKTSYEKELKINKNCLRKFKKGK